MKAAPRRGWCRAGPLALFGIGLALLAPVESVQRWVQRGSGLLFTARILDPRSILAGQVAAADESAGPSPWVERRLEETRRALHPSSAWRGEGEFHSVAVGQLRSPERLELALFGSVPPDQPVLLGDHPIRGGGDTVLVGFTRQREGHRPEVVPITAKSFRIAAFAGVPGQPEPLVFVAQGENAPLLSVQGPRSLHGLKDGDLVWVNPAFADVLPGEWQLPTREILILGTIWRDPDELEVDRAYHVVPAWRAAELREVVVRYPPGFPGPLELAWRERRVGVVRPCTQDRGRTGWVLGSGRERGFLPGAAVAAGDRLIGHVVQSGYGVALVRGVTDLEFEARVFLVTDRHCVPWMLRVDRVDVRGVRLHGEPPAAGLDGATVATTHASELVPPGLILGTLVHRDGGWWLETPAAPLPAVSVFIPRADLEPVE